ncbi:hypothetical protein PCS_02607 [Desulfocurvibacter africanus PCS]|uniref:DUF1064 domain-containing protein n=1 Tax=Desulfocurvibacter africanus PCS TaxID=1262666 RepID=M5PRA6_DESAF|nr:hypothetical protein [Desulfocurvibacter africanus]EMG36595.1 hypothetical protein PCS_02607 [Desulfocurvibacter africanus PCS]
MRVSARDIKAAGGLDKLLAAKGRENGTRPKPFRERREPGRMNKTEARYRDEVLEPARASGEIVDYRFEALKLRLADLTFYTPDFFVVRREFMEVVEIKGHWEDDARVKIKVAAEQYPCFKFTALRFVKGRWEQEEF